MKWIIILAIVGVVVWLLTRNRGAPARTRLPRRAPDRHHGGGGWGSDGDGGDGGGNGGGGE